MRDFDWDLLMQVCSVALVCMIGLGVAALIVAMVVAAWQAAWYVGLLATVFVVAVAGLLTGLMMDRR